ncbi:MAG: PIN domain-containing protein [Anaerolineae bacterium]|nr:PIN domain-containing protein [Anaerolineae bacterium]
MSDRILLDTNLWVYLFTSSENEKQQKIQTLIDDNFQSVVVSSQILGELFNVFTKKNLKSTEAAKEVILEIVATFPVVEVDTLKVLQAININTKYGYSYWDSLILATALVNNCATVYSEDMHHDQLIEDTLRITNPLL